MEYKLCILAAGLGKRMQYLTKNINKALLPINSKAAISHIIEKHEKDIEIVVAVNYQSEKIKQYLSCAHPERKITFVEVPTITQLGSGPGFSLICCEKYLNIPFILSTVDTLFIENCPLPITNWMGVDHIEDPTNFCTILLDKEKNNIKSFIEKNKNGSDLAFIGIAGIKDYKEFFLSLKNDNSETNGEIQVSNGFKGLLKQELKAKKFSWFDVGNIEGYKLTNNFFSKDKNSFDFSKNDEYIYFVNNYVIKYFADTEIVSNRVKRSEILGELSPKINRKSNYFYSYEMLNGKVFYDQKDKSLVKILLKWLHKELWVKKQIQAQKKIEFVKACRNFYYKKTINRLKEYYSRFNVSDQISFINGFKIEKVSHLMEQIDFDWLSQGLPTIFHGDLQFDNILVTDDKKFKLLDWRQDFAGLTDYGDMYYDLAKLNGGLYISYKKIKQNKFQINFSEDKVNLSSEKDEFLIYSKKIFNIFVKENNLDLKKIEILTGLIYLNMSPMHHYPFSHYVYHLGKAQLHKWITNNKTLSS